MLSDGHARTGNPSSDGGTVRSGSWRRSAAIFPGIQRQLDRRATGFIPVAEGGDSTKLASLRVAPWRPARPLVAEEGDSTRRAGRVGSDSDRQPRNASYRNRALSTAWSALPKGPPAAIMPTAILMLPRCWSVCFSGVWTSSASHPFATLTIAVETRKPANGCMNRLGRHRKPSA